MDGRWCVGAINLQGCQLLFWHFFLFDKEKSALSPLQREIVRRGEFRAELECTRAPSVFLLRKNPPPSRREANGRFAPEGGEMEFVRGRKFPRTRRTVEDACPYKRKKCARGRSARNKIRVLPAAVGGEKSVIGGIGNPSVAPPFAPKICACDDVTIFLGRYLERQRRSNRRFVTLMLASKCSSCNFSFKQRKVKRFPFFKKSHRFIKPLPSSYYDGKKGRSL